MLREGLNKFIIRISETFHRIYLTFKNIISHASQPSKKYRTRKKLIIGDISCFARQKYEVLNKN